MYNLAFLLGSVIVVLFAFCVGVLVGIGYCCKLGVEKVCSILRKRIMNNGE